MVTRDRPEVLDAPVLAHPLVTLEPLAHAHADDLVLAAGGGDLWQRARFTSVPAPDREAMLAEIDRRLGLHAAGSMVPWAVVVDGRAVGMTTFMHIDAATPRLEIGSTWLAVAQQGTGVNAAMKLLLLERAFDRLGCVAVELRTHVRNVQSRAAIERLGAHQDGILRSHVLHRGVLRDTVVSSIVAAEWPAVRAGLVARLDARAQARPASGEN
nr:GNAT family protein [Agrococcus sp. Marseille-P2731]